MGIWIGRAKKRENAEQKATSSFVATTGADMKEGGQVAESTSTTLTTRFAAIQLKMLHLQFRMKKIHQDQQALSAAWHKTNRDMIRGLLPAAYTFIDMLVSLEHMAGLVRDIFATPELRNRFDRDTYEILNRTRKAAERWLPVRNCLGGHIDIKVIDELCRRHGYRGVFCPASTILPAGDN